MSSSRMITGIALLVVTTAVSASFSGSEGLPGFRADEPQNAVCPDLGYRVVDDAMSGLRVVEVPRGSLADLGGVIVDDRIVGINRDVVTDIDSCRQIMEGTTGSMIRLQMQRGDVVIQSSVPLDTSSIPELLERAISAPRRCATFSLDRDKGQWVESGCMVIEHKACTGCRQGL